jgi:hypothetical protein
MLQIVLSALVTNALMLSSWRCEPRSSHSTFLLVLFSRPRQSGATRAQRGYRASGFVLWPIAAQGEWRCVSALGES